MKLEKFPVYVNGEEYKISLRRKYDETSCCFYWKVKFYKLGKFKNVFSTYVEDAPARDYVKMARIAVEKFEWDINHEANMKNKLKSFEEWDGK